MKYSSSLYRASEKFRKLAADVLQGVSPENKIKARAIDILELVKAKAVKKDVEATKAIAQLEQLLNAPQNLKPSAVKDLVQGLELDLGMYPENAEFMKELEPMILQLNDEVTNIEMSAKQTGTTNKMPIQNKSEIQQQVEQSKPTATSHYPKIDPNVQKGLNYLGYPVALDPDGSLGPETKKGLDWFEKSFGLMPNTPMPTLLSQLAHETQKKLQGIKEEASGIANKMPQQVPGPLVNPPKP